MQAEAVKDVPVKEFVQLGQSDIPGIDIGSFIL